MKSNLKLMLIAGALLLSACSGTSTSMTSNMAADSGCFPSCQHQGGSGPSKGNALGSSMSNYSDDLLHAD